MEIIKNILFITTRKIFINPFNETCIFNIENLKKENQSKLRANFETEDLYNQICKIISSTEHEIKGILIDYELNGYGDCFAISHHIRLYHNTKINKLPIIITHNEPLILSNKTYSRINDMQLFDLNAISFGLYHELFEKDELSGKINLYNIIDDFKKEFNFEHYIRHLEILPPDTTTRHQIANEWGAFKLANEAGFDISHNLPQTLYFKYLKKKFSKNIEKKRQTIFEDKLNVLLIDDNYHKGWNEALDEILPANIDAFDNFHDALGYISDDNYNKYNSYDIVFLDLYMPGGEKTFEIETSKKILSALKKFNPAVPIIVFTASNKVWNLQTLTELGADGYFVKESPESANTPNFSKENYDSFKKTVKNVFKKGKLLNKYWEAIILIKNNYLEEIIDNSNSNQKKNSTLFRSRINERLNMFFGLFKRGLEQNKFNEEHFFFSYYELSYMTLWSILNEIQEAYFDKSKPETSAYDERTKKKIKFHPNGKPITYLTIPDKIQHFLWKIKNQEDIFIEYKYRIRYDKNNPLKNTSNYYMMDNEQLSMLKLTKNSFEIIETTERTKVDYGTKLSNQIAFLILQKNEFKTDYRKNDFLKNLKNLNALRNHLYITHGDNIGKGFYAKTEKEKRKEKRITPAGKIRDLFQLVAFLLIGAESKKVDEILKDV